MLVSYAQNFEDAMLWRALGHVDKGCYVDVGALHPLIDSVSLMFYERGWRGIHVEPAPPYAELLRQSRPDEIVIQAAVVARSEVLTFYEFPDTGLSTCNLEIARCHTANGHRMREIVVPGITLDEVLSRTAGDDVHWLKIDVEGGEAQVIQGWERSALRPWVILLESTVPCSQIESHNSWEALVLEKGYKFAYFDGLNRYYIANGHPELFQAFRFGPNVFDGFSLNGTASSQLCATLNERFQTLKRQSEIERQEQEKLLDLQRNKYCEQLRAIQFDAVQMGQTAAFEHKRLNDRLHASYSALASLSQLLSAREQESQRQLQSMQNEALAVTSQLAIRETEHAAALRDGQQQVHTISKQLRSREQELAWEMDCANKCASALADAQQENRDLQRRIEDVLALARRHVETQAGAIKLADAEATRSKFLWLTSLTKIRTEITELRLQLQRHACELDTEKKRIGHEFVQIRVQHEQ